ncbi:MAG TPA: ATP-NAD kinase family protein [Terrimesophilobacter sp.]|nr:ATP-NAD kinase family protein [Terrimesophilobacter sp.]
MSVFRCGLIVNPVAGLGGEAALKGSDGEATQRLATQRGGVSRATERAVRALLPFGAIPDFEVVTGAGLLGADAAERAGVRHRVVYRQAEASSTASDTKRLAGMLVDEYVDLIVFAGGDGTARDLCEVLGESQTVLGIPSGVKMHSAVFAVTPEDAGNIVQASMRGAVDRVVADVVDIDEAARRSGRLQSRLYGRMLVPHAARGIQSGKRSSVPPGSTTVAGIAAEVAARLRPGETCLFGPGTTIQAIGRSLGFEFSLLGVDAVRDGVVVGTDLDAAGLNRTVGSGRFQVVVSPVGGQGIVLGRGNQQLDDRLLERLSPDDLIVACTVQKLGELAGGPLLLDAPTVALNRKFAGIRRVVTGYRQEAAVRVS